MAKPKIVLLVDIVSPFAYMAFYALQNLPVFKQCEIKYVPIFLGGVMKACGNTAPINIKNKDKWIETERLRWARLFDIPMAKSMPEGFPPLTINVQRALTALSLSNPEALPDAISAFYKAFWQETKPIQRNETILAALIPVIGEKDANNVIEMIGQKEVKDLLIKRSEEAVTTGTFGLPWFIATNKDGKTESFWGFDHLGQVTDYLGLERPSSGGWKAML
ncbi:HCCA isomerase/glutathione S-transferase kappa [Saccharata proteae CBS 121410]|uniref:Glutathione S-transferase kappa n=1 Tax=Saccharata proteae CBS 121410 TaxID=1314787 RepID=A0A9P4HS06_9PEZI|nr:HCCA isomerase/glutathione S-transferase kappa [Saccharata proteae CBS 121410]